MQNLAQDQAQDQVAPTEVDPLVEEVMVVDLVEAVGLVEAVEDAVDYSVIFQDFI